jgi:hypothetical protein
VLRTRTTRLLSAGVSRSARDPVLRLVRLTVGLAVGATVAQSLTTAANLFVLDGSADSLDATVEGGIWTWAAAGSTLVAAVAAATIATALDVAPREARRLWLLAAVLAFFSLDDWLVLHERVGDWLRDGLGAPEYVGGLWVLAYPPLLLVVGWGIWRTAVEAAPPLRRLLVVALALLAAAVVVEFIGVGTKAIEESTGNADPHDLRAILEEGTELAAWILAAGGLLALLVAKAIRAGQTWEAGFPAADGGD